MNIMSSLPGSLFAAQIRFMIGCSEANSMKIVQTLDTQTKIGSSILTIGSFDGVHRGHQLLLQQTAEMARAKKCEAWLMTLWPHPLKVLRPDVPVMNLSTLDERMELLAETSLIDGVIVFPFDEQAAQLTPRAFLESILQVIDLRGVVVGKDFAFGHNREGNITYLKDYGSEHGFEVVDSALETDQERRISSSWIRELVRDGKIDEAEKLLGHSYSLQGTVIEGDKRGRTIGFPTANLEIDPDKCLPHDGVYAVRASCKNKHIHTHPAVMNIGVRPTVDGSRRTVEIHLLDLNVDVYGEILQAEIVTYLRGEQKFAGLDELKHQISLDAAKAREILTGRGTNNERPLKV